MRQVEVSKDIEAPRAAVWAVLADFPNIAAWNRGVTRSFATSEAVAGVGASRHCDLAPMGQLHETVAEWSPEERMVVRIDAVAKLPIRNGQVTFTLGGGDDGVTPTELRYAYAPRFGPLGAVIAPLLDRQLRRGFTGFLEDLSTAAHRLATRDPNAS